MAKSAFKSTANICFECERACGGCPWTATDPETNKIKFEPVPGWTAEKVTLRVGNDHGKRVCIDNYHITACPLFKPSRRGGRNGRC